MHGTDVEVTTTTVAVRKAAMRDIPAIIELINWYATSGIMLPRTEFEMSENIRDFSVAYDEAHTPLGAAPGERRNSADLPAPGESVVRGSSVPRLVGCGALHFYTPTVAEVRSLAVRPECKEHGVGRALVNALETEARDNDLESIFAFTYVPGFFAKLGFSEVERGELPLKAWKDCLRCPKFQNCDEIAVMKRLRPKTGYRHPRNAEIFAVTGLVQLPFPARNT